MRSAGAHRSSRSRPAPTASSGACSRWTRTLRKATSPSASPTGPRPTLELGGLLLGVAGALDDLAGAEHLHLEGGSRRPGGRPAANLLDTVLRHTVHAF